MGTNKKILIICEGSFEVNLFNKIIELYPIDFEYSFYEYRTNIHILRTSLDEYFNEDNFEISDIDIIQVLKEFRYENVLELKFTDILLVFDFEPQDARFNKHYLIKLQDFFCDSTNQGQLYINYPMVESALDFTKIPDIDFNLRRIQRNSLYRSQYKIKVQKTSCIRVISNINMPILKCVLSQIYLKAKFIINIDEIDYLKLLEVECKLLIDTSYIDVINTSVLFLFDYNQSEFLNFIQD